MKLLGEPTLKKIARELLINVRKNVSIDWTVRGQLHSSHLPCIHVQRRLLKEFGLFRAYRRSQKLPALEELFVSN